MLYTIDIMGYGNPEQSAINNLDSRKRPDDIKDTADLLLPMHDRVSQLMEQIAIKPEDFRDLYGDGVDKDAQYVDKRKASFKTTENKEITAGLNEGEVRKLAEILEYQIIRGINVGKWLPFCTAVKTSEFDDIAHGVDMVIEFQKLTQYGHLGMGVDVSFSHNLQSKFQRIKDEIDNFDGKNNRLGVVKYFNSEKTGMRGELSGLPRVVVALDIKIIEDLARVKNDDIPNHIVQHEVVLEIEHQLAVFADYAQMRNPLCLDQIMRAQNFMRTISLHLESEAQLKNSEYGKNRKIQEAVERGLTLFKS